MTNIDKVREWRTIAGQPMNTGKVSELAIKLIQEEANELIGAIQSGDLKEIAKELCDLEYVLLGAEIEGGWESVLSDRRIPSSGLDMKWAKATIQNFVNYEYGVNSSLTYLLRRALNDIFYYVFPEKDFDTAFAEVHRSNMSKFVNGKCLKRDDGKILKGPDFSPADMGFMVPGLEELKRMPEYLNTGK